VDLYLIFGPLQKEWDSELDLDELEFLLSNLFANSLIKGYLSHEERMLVLPNENAFPKID